jgi:hypothetical protein
MKMKKLKLTFGSKRKASEGKSVAVSQAAVPVADMQAKARNDEIIFRAVGTSDKKGKFLLVTKGEEYVVLSVRALARNSGATELERLEALDVHFLVPGSRTKFLAQAEAAAKVKATFKVATQIGWYDEFFVLPKRVNPPQLQIVGMPKGVSKFLVYLDAKDEDVHSRFYCSGSPEKCRAVYRLCRGNSRLIFAAALSFVGPCCKPFKLRAPGIQPVGDAGGGKTVFGIIAGATWGGVPGSTLGFGSAWNGTPNGLEEYPPAHKNTLMILDETGLMPSDSKGRVLSFGEALMRLAQGQGKKRFGVDIERWSVPLISTSNRSVYALLDPKRREHYEAYCDRLIDIPSPNHSASFFEDLHGYQDADAFGKYLFDLATENFGYPGHVFLDRLTAALAEDGAGLAARVAADVAKYQIAAEGIISAVRSVQRVRGYFATIFAVGCLAKRLGILPFSEVELLVAVLSCHRDHVAFVDQEVAGGPQWVVKGAEAQGTQEAGTTGKPLAGAAKPAERPYDRARRFVNANRKGGFQDLRNAKAGDPFVPSAVGYIGKHDGRTEYWIPAPTFRKIAGSKAEDLALKQELYDRGLLVTARRGDSVSYVVKRALPDGSRRFFVVLRAEARRTVA